MQAIITLKERKVYLNNWCCLMILIVGLVLPGLVFSDTVTAQAYLEDARTLIDKGENSAAVIQLKNVLLLEPDNVGALLLLGRAYLELGRNDELLQEITPEEQFTDTVRANILQLQGQAYLAKRQFPEAEEKFLAVLVLQPDNSEALLGRARVAYHKQDREQASELIEEVLQRDPRSADAWIMQGSLLSNAGDQQGAITAYQQALDIAPEMSTARAAKVSAHIALGEYDMASEEIERLRSTYPNSYLTYYLDALVQFQKQDMNRALTLVHDTLKLAPGHLPSQLLAGSIYYQKGQYKQAVEYLRPYWNTYPGHIQSAKQLAVSLVKIDKQQDAIEVLEKSVEIKPDNAKMLALLGSLYIRNGQAAKGLEILEEAIEIAPDSASIRTELAIGHLATGDAGQAVTKLQGAVELDDELIQADPLLVMMYIKQGKHDQAVAAAQQFVAKHPDIAIPLNLLGSAYFARLDFKAARAAFEQALVLDPEFVLPQLHLASIDLVERDRESAERRYRAVLKQDEGNQQALLALAKMAVEQGQKEEAKQLLLQARASHPDAIKPTLLLVELYRQEQDVNLALDLAQSVGKAHPRNPGVLKVLVRVQMDAGEIDAAIVSMQTLIDVLPTSAELHYQIALLYLRQKNRTATRQSLERALELRPDYPAAHLSLGRIDIVDKNYVAAQAIASVLQKSHPQAAYGFELQGDILVAQGNYRQAELAYEKAYTLKASARLATGLFNMRRLTRESDKAIAALRHWLMQHPGDLAIRMTLASYLRQQGRQDEAIEECLAILTHDPDNITALNLIAVLYQQQGSDKGIAYAEHAYELVPQRPDIIDTLGWLLVQNGDHQRGLILLQEAVTKAPRMPEIRYHMAVALAEVGRREEARQQLERVLGGKDFPAAGEAGALLERLNRK